MVQMWMRYILLKSVGSKNASMTNLKWHVTSLAYVVLGLHTYLLLYTFVPYKSLYKSCNRLIVSENVENNDFGWIFISCIGIVLYTVKVAFLVTLGMHTHKLSKITFPPSPLIDLLTDDDNAYVFIFFPLNLGYLLLFLTVDPALFNSRLIVLGFITRVKKENRFTQLIQIWRHLVGKANIQCLYASTLHTFKLC